MLINSTDMLHLPPSVTGLRHFPIELIFLTLLLTINSTMQLQKHFLSNRYWDPLVYLLQLINSMNIDISMLKPCNNFMGFKTEHIVGNKTKERNTTGVSRKGSTSNFPKNAHFLPLDTHTYVPYFPIKDFK